MGSEKESSFEERWLHNEQRAQRLATLFGFEGHQIKRELFGEVAIVVSESQFRKFIDEQAPEQLSFVEDRAGDDGQYERLSCQVEAGVNIKTTALPFAHFNSGVLQGTHPYRRVEENQGETLMLHPKKGLYILERSESTE